MGRAAIPRQSKDVNDKGQISFIRMQTFAHYFAHYVVQIMARGDISFEDGYVVHRLGAGHRMTAPVSIMNWSTWRWHLRVPHFLGLHVPQLLYILVGFFIRRHER